MSNVFKTYRLNSSTPVVLSHPVEPDPVELENDLPESDTDHAEIIINDAMAEAESIVNKAQITAKKLLEDARKEIEEMRLIVLQEAREKGYSEGYNEAIRKAESILNEAEEIKQAARKEYEELLDGAEDDIIRLVRDICKKVIGDELETRPDKISMLVAQTLKECKETDSAIVKVSPEDFDAVYENSDNILRSAGYSGQLEIKKDIALKQGDCIVETPVGNVDASVDVQLESIEKVLVDNLQQKE